MIYVTGDTHGSNHLGKLEGEQWPAGRGLKRDDLVLVCGDFGGVLRLEKRDRDILDWWEAQPWTTLFIDGNHDNIDALDAMPTEQRYGAPVHVVPEHPHVIHLMRGYVYELPVSPDTTTSVLAMGGAASRDLNSRTEGYDWWARELPSDEEYDRCSASLGARDWRVDYVVTHELPADLRMPALDWRSYSSLLSGADTLTNYLQWVYDRLDKEALHCWYAGHYHKDLYVDEKVRVLFDDIVELSA